MSQFRFPNVVAGRSTSVNGRSFKHLFETGRQLTEPVKQRDWLFEIIEHKWFQSAIRQTICRRMPYWLQFASLDELSALLTDEFFLRQVSEPMAGFADVPSHKLLRRILETLRTRGRRLFLKELGQRRHKSRDGHVTWYVPLTDEVSASKKSEDRTPLDIVVKLEQNAAIHRALNVLSPAQRLAIHYFFFCGLTHQEIAVKMGIGHQGLRGILDIAKRRLRSALAWMSKG